MVSSSMQVRFVDLLQVCSLRPFKDVNLNDKHMNPRFKAKLRG